MAAKLRLALLGIGKIARDQHLPAIAASRDFELVAAVSRNARVDGVANFHDLAALVASGLPVDAVSLASPPVGRHAIAASALGAGWHVMLEKPPGATLSEVRALIAQAHVAGHTLYTSWHSRAAAAVAPAKAWLADRRITAASITWREDIRHWHPGQDWLLAAGGLGVFDPGINALSIVTRILPGALRVEAARLVFPADRGAPIAATLTLVHADDARIAADFDFRQTGPQSWDIAIDTDGGRVTLADGGGAWSIDSAPQPVPETAEYPGLYRHFAELIRSGASDTDLAPLELVADAFLIGEREETEAFAF